MKKPPCIKAHVTAIPVVLMLCAGLLANPAKGQELVISGVYDGPLSGGIPKGVEIYVVSNIADLSIFGLGSANNGGGSDGEEFTFPAVTANAGDFIYVASESPSFTTFFGFSPDYTAGAMSINGDDAIELFKSGVVVDVMGDINVDGNGEPWEYLDGWAYRASDTGPDGSVFMLGSWTFSGANAWDGESSNGTAATPFPVATYTLNLGDVAPKVSSTVPDDGADDVAPGADIKITFSEAVMVDGQWYDIACDSSGDHSGVASNSDDTTFLIDPDSDFSAGDSCTVTIFAAQVTDMDESLDSMVEDFIFSFGVPLPPPLLPVHEVQGAGRSSPYEGERVIVEAVVTGDFQDGDADEQSNLRGFYVQEEDADADADPLTSEGIFVFDAATLLVVDVGVGDRVRVAGTATEFFGETQISASQVEIIGSGSGLVTATDIPFPAAVIVANDEYIPDREQYEGMLVSFAEQLTVTELFNLDRFGELLLAKGGQFVQFTNNNAPDPAGVDAHLREIASRSMMLDDGLSVQNPNPIRYPDPGLPNLVGAAVRGGDSVVGLTGNIRYSRGSGGSGDETYRLMPTSEPVFIVDNLRPDSAPVVGGSLRVASFNVLNFFTTLDGNGRICGPDMDQNCRGADSQDEFDRQRTKLLTALVALDADIVGLVELENNTSASLQSLVEGINAISGPASYQYLDTGTIGDDAIKVGFIYKTASVAPVGAPAVLDSSVDPRFLDTKNRPALAQSFQETASAGVVTVVVNHLKSKGSSCEDVGDPDAGDGQANCNGTRTDAALAMADWLAGDPTGSNDSDILIMGDLNAYLREDPVRALEEAGYTNLLSSVVGPNAYSFLFDGQVGALDHALSSASLTDQVSGVAEWHINADEADAIDYNLDFGRNPDFFDGDIPYRASDHDPVVVGLNLSGDLDGDGVLNSDDECPMTPAGEIVDPENGCSLSQLSPCEGPFGSADGWRNHGEYVSSVAANAKQFVNLGLIPKKSKGKIVSAAARSSCGK
jgi:predicted extracellular nuclease